jgi:hypothetical protein
MKGFLLKVVNSEIVDCGKLIEIQMNISLFHYPSMRQNKSWVQQVTRYKKQQNDTYMCIEPEFTPEPLETQEFFLPEEEVDRVPSSPTPELVGHPEVEPVPRRTKRQRQNLAERPSVTSFF